MSKASKLFGYSALLSRGERLRSAVAKIPNLNYRGRDERLPSLSTTAHDTSPPTEKVYTGTAIVGIGVMHKSNAVPVFSQSEAEDLAKMRR